MARASAVNLQALVTTAYDLHRAGRPERARPLYRKVLLVQPALALVQSLLGDATAKLGESAEACRLLGRAVRLEPGRAAFRLLLANAEAGAGALAEAEADFAAAMRLGPGDPAIWNDWANAIRAEDPGRAARLYRKAALLAPGRAEFWRHLGQAQAQRAATRPAARLALGRALRLAPNAPATWMHLAHLAEEEGRHAAALSCHRAALALAPGHAGEMANLMLAAASTGADEAMLERLFRRGRCLDPAAPLLLFNRANRLAERGLFGAAVAWLKAALTVQPDGAKAVFLLAHALRQSRHLGEGERQIRHGLVLDPGNLRAKSILLMAMQYRPGITAERLFEAHRAWAEAAAPAERPLAYAVDRDPARRLRLGFVSPDLKRHPVGYFLAPVLEHLDKDEFDIAVYTDFPGEDDVTRRLAARSDVWRRTAKLPDEALARAIEDDRVDLLFDLSGHTAGNRLAVFARRAAPLQLTWAGYVGTTGLPQIDYLVTDRWQTAPGTERHYAERWLTLGADYICYRPPVAVAPAELPPAMARGYVTFGCFNNPAKVGDGVLALWARALAAVPASRLRLVYRGYGDPGVQADVRRVLVAEGISGERVEFGVEPSVEATLRAYAGIDIALDSFPYSGGLTTCEALSQGVPVVTLATGDSFASRHSLSHLSNIGRPEWAAASEADFVAIAAGLAGDLARLAEIRRALPVELAASPLADAANFAADLGRRLRAVWQAYCAVD